MKKSVFFFFVILFSCLIWLMWHKSNKLQKEVILLKHQRDSIETEYKIMENMEQRRSSTLYYIIDKYNINENEVVEYYESQTE